jgi:uncharacterized membrane protein
MPFWLKATGIIGSATALIGSAGYLTIENKWGSIFVILALIISLLKQIIAFIGFLTTAIQVLIIIVFVALFLGVGLLVFRAFRDKQKAKE